MNTLQVRRRQAEWMDRPDLDTLEHEHALRGLRRINGLSRASRILWRAVRNEALRAEPAANVRTRLRVLDVACGGGDVLVRLAAQAEREGFDIQWTGFDISETALTTAERHAQQSGCSSIRFEPWDVLQHPLPQTFDVIMCSLFLHHLDEPEAIELLRNMAVSARVAILVNDLQRSWLGYWLARLGTQILTRSPIVHFDGPVSVEGAWTCSEVARLATAAGLQHFTITKHFPERFLLRWSRP